MAGVESVDVDLERKVVVVRGDALADDEIRAAIDEAGYDVRRASASVTLGAPARLALFCAGLTLVGGVAALAGAANRRTHARQRALRPDDCDAR